MLLPPLTDPEACAEFRSNPEWVAEVCDRFERKLGLKGPGIPLPTSSAVLAQFGNSVLKLFFPIQVDEARREERLLQQLTGRLPVDTPALVERGEDSMWPYHVTSNVPGEDLDAVWGDLAPHERVHIATQLGQTLSELHRLRPPGELAVTWPIWSRVQVSGAIDQHRRGGCPRHLLEQLPGYLRFADLTVGERGIGLIHTSVAPEHLKVERRADRWELCGLFGFADAFVGPVDYEFGPVGIRFSQGDHAVLHAVLSAYGLDLESPELAKRLFALALIHTEADLGGWLRESGLDEAPTLDTLAEHWFGVG